MAALDNAHHAIAFNAGIATLTAIMTMLEAGDGVISSRGFYTGGLKVLDAYAKLGIDVQYVDFTEIKNLEGALKVKFK